MTWRAAVLTVVFAGGLISPIESSVFFQVDPGIVEISIPPGRRAKGVLTVTNPSEFSMVCHVSARDEWAQRSPLPAPPPAEWLLLPGKTPFRLGPRASRRVPYTINAPAGFTGEAMAMLLFSAGSPGDPVRLTKGIPLYLIAKGNESVRASVSSVHATRDPNGQIQFSVSLKNEGNVHVRPEGEVTTQRLEPSGAPPARHPFVYGSPVFPGTSEIFFASADLRRFPGSYRGRISFLEKNVLLCNHEFDFVVSPSGEIQLQGS